MITVWKRMILVIGAAIVPAILLFGSTPAQTAAEDDGSVLYKSKCVACHGATAEKRFDNSKADDELTQTVLKGKKQEKPPNMPGYEEKGITADQAKALVAFMKSQKH